MLRETLVCACAALLAWNLQAQDLDGGREGLLRPVTGPLHRIEGTLDLATGRVRRERHATIGDDGKQEVYDNTCNVGFYFGLRPAGAGGTGSPYAEALGDFGAIPGLAFPGDAVCTTGCATDYDITQFEIAWCQVAAPVTGAVIELDFWDTPQQACVLGTAPGNNPFGGTRPPATSSVLSATLTGLPRSNSIGTLACYVLNVTLPTPGFNLAGSTSFASSVVGGDKFAWAFAMPTSTGSDGPLLTGDLTPFATPCLPCAGTIWEVGGQTTNAGTGAGQTNHVFQETFGGSVMPPSSDCYFFGSQVPVGLHLELFADKPCDFIFESGICNGSDLAACPCGPGHPATGCDTPIPAMQGGGLTGGVGLIAVAQRFSPTNRATLVANGFPTGSTPSGVVFRNNGLDPGSPVVFGDGLRCVDATTGAFTRLGASIAAGGTMTNAFGHGSMSGVGTFFYQLWFRSSPQSYCDPTAGFNTSNAITLDW